MCHEDDDRWRRADRGAEGDPRAAGAGIEAGGADAQEFAAGDSVPDHAEEGGLGAAIVIPAEAGIQIFKYFPNTYLAK